MSTAAPATTRTETDFEPLTIPDEYRASSLVDLVHRTVKRYPAKEALRWKLPRARRQLDGAEPDETGGGDLAQHHVPRDVGLGDAGRAGPQAPRHR